MQNEFFQQFIVQRENKILCQPFDFEIKKGSVILLTGDNGIGKSSALRNMAGLTAKAISDSLHYLGHNLPLHYNLNVAQHLKFYQDFYKGAPNNQQSLSVFLDNITGKTGILSAGQQQRLALSSCWYNLKKKLWLLDEPLTALDQNSQDRFLHRCNEYTNNSGTIIAAVHQKTIWQYYFTNNLQVIELKPAVVEEDFDQW